MSFLRDSDPRSEPGYFGLLGQTPIMLELIRHLKLIATLDAPVLLEGEAGVGRALAAAVLHKSGPRALAPFVTLNAAELSPALFESELFGVAEGAFGGALSSRAGLVAQAEPGTLLIKEVGSLPAASQARLARFVESREIQPVGGRSSRTANVRVLLTATRIAGQDGARTAAAPLDPVLRVAMAPFTLVVPPLKDRLDDLPLLARHFLRETMVRHAKRLGEPSDEVWALLAAYSWPGNVQELEEEMERALILTATGEPIAAEVLSSKVSGRSSNPLGPGLS